MGANASIIPRFSSLSILYSLFCIIYLKTNLPSSGVRTVIAPAGQTSWQQ